MELNLCRTYALEKMRQYGLSHWKFTFSNTKRALGDCHPARKQIRISTYHVQGSEEKEIKDTVLHEIAHALDYERNGSTSHGPKWKEICLEVGAIPKSQKDNAYTIAKPQYKYTATCPQCGPVGGLNRKGSSKYICKKCRSVVKLKQNY